MPAYQRALLLILFMLLAVTTDTKAQNLTELDQLPGLPQLNVDPALIIKSEQRIVNRERLISADQRTSAAAENQPPTFEIAPDIRTIKVGETMRFTFDFGDPEDDPYFAGVIAVNTRIDTESGRIGRKQLAREAPVLIDVLPPLDPSIVTWNITAQNPGISIVFICISELFADTSSGQLKFVAGQVRYVAYPLRVIADNEDTAEPPTFINRMPDFTLRDGETTQLVFGAQSPTNRPLLYNYLFLSFGSRLVRGKFRGSLADLKAIEPGKGVFVAYVTDGNKADVQAFLCTVLDPATPIDPGPQLRALSANAVVGRGLPIPLNVYGENFTTAAQVTLASATGDNAQALPTTYVSPNQLQVTVPDGLKGAFDVIVSDGDVIKSLPFSVIEPVVLDSRLIREKKKTVIGLRIFSYGAGKKAEFFANGVKLKVVPEQSATAKIGEVYVVKLPKQLQQAESLTFTIKNTGGYESLPVTLPAPPTKPNSK